MKSVRDANAGRAVPEHELKRQILGFPACEFCDDNGCDMNCGPASVLAYEVVAAAVFACLRREEGEERDRAVLYMRVFLEELGQIEQASPAKHLLKQFEIELERRTP